MKNRLFFLGLLLFSSAANAMSVACTTDKTIGHTFFSQRSQGSDAARDLVGVTQFLAPCDCDSLNGFFTITPEYTRNFNRDEIGEFFYYNGANSMLVAGRNVAGVDVWSRQIFLNDDFNGTEIILPRVENFNVDIRFRLFLDEWVCGMYFDIHGPICYTRWDLNLDDCQRATAGTEIEQFALGNMNAAPSPNNTISQALFGQTIQTSVFTDLRQTLQFGKIDGAQTKTSVADIETALGYYFVYYECGHLGADIRAIFPTGTRPDAEFLFEPVVGNGKRFELGAGLNGHYEFWNNYCDSSFSFWFTGRVYHMFKGRQRRLFDLSNANGSQNIGSHQLLIKRFTGTPAMPELAEILFGPNVLALECKVRNNVHTDIAFLFDYQRCGFTLDVGYNFWARTHDKITNVKFPANMQDTGLFGVQGGTLGMGDAATMNRTNSLAMINGANTAPADFDVNPVFITCDDINIESAEHPTAMSHKVFVHAQYAWDGCDYTPFIGLGGAVEFSGRRNNALDQWHFWAKGGFAFY